MPQFSNTTVIVLFLFLIFQTIPALADQILRIGGSGTDLATFKLLAQAFQQQNPAVEVVIIPSLGSSGGIKALHAGRLDIALTSRALKDKEKKLPVRAFMYARTPLIFAVHVNNPVEEVDTHKLIEIYEGSDIYWPDGSVARPVLRPRSDSDTLLITRHLPKVRAAMEKAYQRRGVPIAITDQDSVNQIEWIPGAIGTSTLATIISENRPLKALVLNGLSANLVNLQSNRYPIYKELYLVVSERTRKLILKFVKFLNEPSSSNIFIDNGHQYFGVGLNGEESNE